AIDGALADLDFTGKLDLLLVTPGARSIRVLRNLGGNGGSPYFKDITQTSGVPASLTGVSQVVVDDWNNDDVPDLFVARETRSARVAQPRRQRWFPGNDEGSRPGPARQRHDRINCGGRL